MVNILILLAMVIIISLLIALAVSGSKHKRLEDQLEKLSDINDIDRLKSLAEETTDSKRDIRRKRRANRKLSKAKRILRPRK